MPTIQIVLDQELLEEADRTAEALKANRSALFRVALREHLKRLRSRELEEQDRLGYQRTPEDKTDTALWEEAAVWPEE